MKNLSLNTKLIILSTILLLFLAGVGWLSVSGLSNQNAAMKTIGQRDFARLQLVSDAKYTLMNCVRAQKNAVLAPTDKQSEAYSSKSRQLLTEFQGVVESIRSSSDSATSEYVRRIADDAKSLEQENTKCLDLAVQNTNLKGMEALTVEVRKSAEQLLEYSKKLTTESESSKDSANLRNGNQLALQVFQIFQSSLVHLNTSSTTPEFSQIDSQVTNALADIRLLWEKLGADKPTESFRQFETSVNRVLALSKLDTNSKSIEISLTSNFEIVERLTANLDALSKLQKDAVANSIADSEKSYLTARQIIIGSGLLAFVVGFLASVFVSRSIVVPVQRVRNLANQMAGGDLTSRIGLAQSDEVGQMAQATDLLADSLTNVVGKVQSASSKLTTSSAELTDVAKELKNQSQRSSELSSGVATASEQLSTNINTISSAAEEMSMNFSSIASATEEMSMTIGSISTTAEETSSNVSAISTAMRQISESFGSVMVDVHDGAKVASQASQMASTATATMQQLDQSSVEISKVTETIKMIALQTNLLALNATIEATSAGEAGKGFAVVAHEIKQLANQSGKAAEDIANKIETVQKGTQQAVEVIQRIAEIIKDINASAERITTSVDQQSQSAQTIGRNISEANTGVGHIAKSIAEVARAANQMSNNVAEATRGATDVSRNVGEAARAAMAISGSIAEVNRESAKASKSAGEVSHASQSLCLLSEELTQTSTKFKLSND